jgi:hypothetical protein
MRKIEIEGHNTAVTICIIVLVFLCILGAAFGILCLEALLVMWLWNLVVPAIIATAPTIGFWVAMGLMILCNILFGSVVRVSSGKK